jgi:hypothetical protein
VTDEKISKEMLELRKKLEAVTSYPDLTNNDKDNQPCVVETLVQKIQYA